MIDLRHYGRLSTRFYTYQWNIRTASDISDRWYSSYYITYVEEPHIEVTYRIWGVRYLISYRMSESVTLKRYNDIDTDKVRHYRSASRPQPLIPTYLPVYVNRRLYPWRKQSN
jgi:hypothetical protein